MSKVNNMTLTISGPEIYPITHHEWVIKRDNNSIGLIRKGIERGEVDVIFIDPEEPLNIIEMRQIISFMEGISNEKIHTGDNMRCINNQYSGFLIIDMIYPCMDMNIDDMTVRVPGSDVWWDISRFEKVT